MVYCIVRLKTAIVFDSCLISVRCSNRVIGIEVITEFEIGHKGLCAVGEQAVLLSLGIVIGQVERAAKVIVFARIVIHEIGVEVHLQSVLPIGYRHACSIGELVEITSSCYAVEAETVTAPFDSVDTYDGA